MGCKNKNWPKSCSPQMLQVHNRRCSIFKGPWMSWQSRGISCKKNYLRSKKLKIVPQSFTPRWSVPYKSSSSHRMPWMTKPRYRTSRQSYMTLKDKMPIIKKPSKASTQVYSPPIPWWIIPTSQISRSNILSSKWRISMRWWSTVARIYSLWGSLISLKPFKKNSYRKLTQICKFWL